MGARGLRHEAQLMQWREKIVECRSSGKSVLAWCREQGITSKTYYRWEKEVLSTAERQLAVRGSSGSPAFVEVRAAAKERQPWTGTAAARLHTAIGELDIYAGADRETLRAVIEALKDAE